MRVTACIWLVFFLCNSTSVAQPDAIVPGQTLVTQGIPKIPGDLASTVARYTNFRTAVIADWHPRKRQMLVSTRFGDTPQIHAVKFPGGARTQLTFFTDPAFAASYQPVTGD